MMGETGRNGDKDSTSLPPGTRRCRGRVRLPTGAENRALTLRLRWGRNHLKAQDQESQKLPVELLLTQQQASASGNKTKTVTRTQTRSVSG